MISQSLLETGLEVNNIRETSTLTKTSGHMIWLQTTREFSLLKTLFYICSFIQVCTCVTTDWTNSTHGSQRMNSGLFTHWQSLLKAQHPFSPQWRNQYYIRSTVLILTIGQLFQEKVGFLIQFSSSNKLELSAQMSWSLKAA